MQYPETIPTSQIINRIQELELEIQELKSTRKELNYILSVLKSEESDRD